MINSNKDCKHCAFIEKIEKKWHNFDYSYMIDIMQYVSCEETSLAAQLAILAIELQEIQVVVSFFESLGYQDDMPQRVFHSKEVAKKALKINLNTIKSVSLQQKAKFLVERYQNQLIRYNELLTEHNKK